MNNSLFPLQWPPAPVADTSVRLPPLAEQATIALQDLLPVAYSYGSQSKRDEACKASATKHAKHAGIFYHDTIDSGISIKPHIRTDLC